MDKFTQRLGVLMYTITQIHGFLESQGIEITHRAIEVAIKGSKKTLPKLSSGEYEIVKKDNKYVYYITEDGFYLLVSNFFYKHGKRMPFIKESAKKFIETYELKRIAVTAEKLNKFIGEK